MDFKSRLITYVEEHIGEKGFAEGENLFESGYLTSLDVLDLIYFIETEFSLELDDDDVGMEYLGTIEGMDRLIRKYKETDA